MRCTSLNISDTDCCPKVCSNSCEDHVERERELESIGLAKEADEKLGPGLNSFIQLGALPDEPSHPICATCLTSVGYPISISLSFTTNIWEINLKLL